MPLEAIVHHSCRNAAPRDVALPHTHNIYVHTMRSIVVQVPLPGVCWVQKLQTAFEPKLCDEKLMYAIYNRNIFYKGTFHVFH